MKEDKSYSYWPVLLSEILQKKAEDKDSASRPVEVAATIAMKEAPTTKELVEAKCSRFKAKSNSSK